MKEVDMNSDVNISQSVPGETTSKAQNTAAQQGEVLSPDIQNLCDGKNVKKDDRKRDCELNNEESLDGYRHKSQKLAIETGKWSCMNDLCNNADNEEMFECTKCKKLIHYECTNLPAYQVALFLLPKHRGFRCEFCVKVSDSLKEKCAVINKKQADAMISQRDDRLQLQTDRIASMMEVISNLRSRAGLFDDELKEKETLIKEQKVLIEKMKAPKEVECNVEDNISLNIVGLKNDSNVRDENTVLQNYKSVVEKLEIAQNKNLDLRKEVEEKTLILQKTEKNLHEKVILAENETKNKSLLIESIEVAFNERKELLIAKDEIIGNLKKIIATLEKGEKTCKDNNNMTSNEKKAPVPIPKGNGVKECIDFIETHATRGVILNGFLLWANLKRNTKPDRVWKDEAIARFLDEEISEAKNTLWKTCP